MSAKKKSPCPAFGKCGGCSWIDKEYQEEVNEKSKALNKLLAPFVKTEEFIAMEDPYHYRNKVLSTFGEDSKHNIISGIYEEKSRRIVPMDNCLLENKKADEIIVTIRGLLKSFKIRPYNERNGFGLLKHVLVRVGYSTGQIMVVLVLTSPILPSKNNFVKALIKVHPEISTIVINVNERNTSMVLGKRDIPVYGKGYIEDELCGMRFRISPQSFYQVNPVQAEILYKKAMEFASLAGSESVLDAYCGTGTIGLIASRNAKNVIGVELNPEAVKDAVNNARANGVKNASFYCDDATSFIGKMAEEGVKCDVVLMDPPRSGSTEEFLKAVVRMGPEKVVYVSCNPETLARDLKFITKRGYKVSRAVGVEMFPWTNHVESCVLLQRVSNTRPKAITLDVEMEDYYRIKGVRTND
ncbi:MAG: 23S rRNA (uracil(1939)-C(5))-methyltransferase RlmD [Lachnospiraceae bacterium]|nr:23S rRNA (uracil(1939)-C(5))-methyltransferase RlmD [Lachnospiraceae bacterium]